MIENIKKLIVGCSRCVKMRKKQRWLTQTTHLLGTYEYIYYNHHVIVHILYSGMTQTTHLLGTYEYIYYNHHVIVHIHILYSGMTLIAIVHILYSGMTLIAIVHILYSGMTLIAIVHILYSGMTLIVSKCKCKYWLRFLSMVLWIISIHPHPKPRWGLTIPFVVFII